MANRYWVGGTGSWDATTTHWSATSGGASGASVPTSADDVFFDTLSNATLYTCTLTTAPICRSLSVAGPATGNVTMAGSPTWLIYGSLTIAATGVTWSVTSGIFFSQPTSGFTLTTNGITILGSLSFQGTGGMTLGSALTTSQSVNVVAGTFSTANFNITTTNNFILTGTFTRAINLGSSAISCASWSALAATNLTVNAGTSTITVTNAAGTFNGGGLTYYNVTKASNGFAIGDGGNTFNALTNTTITASGAFPCSFAGDQTIGTLTVNGGSGGSGITGRASIQTPSTLAGTQVTLTVASFITNGFVDFRDINFAGAASPLTVATGGDCGNNTNITLQAPKTVYWSLVAGGVFNSATAWATTSGGAPAQANFPLPQDTAIFDNTGLNSGASITFSNNPTFGTLDMSTRTLPMTFAVSNSAANIYGDFTLSSSVTTTATTGSLTFSGYNKTQTITSAGVTIACQITVNGTSTTFALGGALTMTPQFALTLGTLNLANNNLTTSNFSSTNTNTRSITFGTGQINVTGNNGFLINLDIMTGFTYTGSGIFNYTYSGATGTRYCIFGNSGGGTEANALNLNVTAGTDSIGVYGYGYKNVNFTGFAGTFIDFGGKTIFGDLTISTGMTVTATTLTQFSATSGTQNITSNGKTITFPITKTGAGTLRLVDALTLGSTLTFTLTTGTLDLNGKTATTGLFASTGSSVRSIAFGGGSIVTTGATFTASGTNLTTTGPGTISMTSASSKTFAGGGFSYPTLNQGGAGALVITGANTFANITNTVQPATVTFPASTTTTVANFNLNGTSGNLITLNSSTVGTQATLLKVSGGLVDVGYLSIKDSNATPLLTWYAGTTSTDAGNNTGWTFTASPYVVVQEYPINLRSFTEPRRF